MSNSLLLSSLIVAVLVIGLPTLFHFTRYIGAKSDNPRKNETYESGIRNYAEDPSHIFDVRFFLVGVIFLIFDVEVLYMLPWALSLRELGVFGMLEMFLFMILLIGGLVYVYRSGILKWI